MQYSEPTIAVGASEIVHERVLEHPSVGSIQSSPNRTMFSSDPNGLEGIDSIKHDAEQAILLHSWAQTADCPACSCESTLLLGPETRADDRYAEVVDCELCDAVMQAIVGDVAELP